MTHWPKWILRIGAILLVLVALAVSGLRLALPHIDSYRPQLLSLLSRVSGTSVHADQIRAHWLNQGPVVSIHNLNLRLADHSTLSIGEISLSLNIWRSLVSSHWQFNDLTFNQLHYKTTQGVGSHNTSTSSGLSSEQIQQLFLHRFNHFILRDSTLEFPAPSGQQVRLAISTLTWFNQDQSHRAEGLVNLSSHQGEHGSAQLRVNLRDKAGVIDQGKIWLQAEEIDATPWLGRWMNQQSALQTAHLSLSLWLQVDHGSLVGGDIVIPQGEARWRPLNPGGPEVTHQLQISNLHAQLKQAGLGWQLQVPHRAISLDGAPWSVGGMDLYWQPDKQRQFLPRDGAELRVRTSQVNLQRIAPLIALFAPLSQEMDEFWRTAQPRGIFDKIAIDMPLVDPRQSRLQVQWQGLSWNAWRWLPAINGLQGDLGGELQHGAVALSLGKQSIDTLGQLPAPLELDHFRGILGWDLRDKALEVTGHQLDIAARSLAAAGDFRYQQPVGQPTHLEILAGIKTTQGADAWRYFPIKVMPKGLVSYLSTAIQGGITNNATLLFSGDPHQFPFAHQQGKFQVTVPLTQAKFAFQPDWPALENQAIELNFVNNGLWMSAAQARLGQVEAREVTANIPDYQQDKLFVSARLAGDGQAIGRYFNRTPLAKSIGSALQQVQVKGPVNGDLQLTIPFNGEQVKAKGKVNLRNNQLFIKPLSSQLQRVNGSFSYENGHLQSQPISADWYGQPIKLNFSTQERAEAFAIDIALGGCWDPAQLTLLPSTLRQRLAGRLPWQSQVAIKLPHHGGATYNVALQGDARHVTGELPKSLGIDPKQPFPFSLKAQGDLQQFQLQGVFDEQQRVNSRWQLGSRLSLERGQWQTQTHRTPDLPLAKKFIFNLPSLDGDRIFHAWQHSAAVSPLATTQRQVKQSATKQAAPQVKLPTLEFSTPQLILGGQTWQQVKLTLSDPLQSTIDFQAQSRELQGTLRVRADQPWDLKLAYLYFNPAKNAGVSMPAHSSDQERVVDFRRWPDINLLCQQCWFAGQNFGKLRADLHILGGKLVLTNGLMDNGQAQLTFSGKWNNQPGKARSALKGRFHTGSLQNTLIWFGQQPPITDTALDLNFDLYWANLPWQPELGSLSGLLDLSTGSGTIEQINTGRAGQILRLFSFDGLLRKLRLDFNDTLNRGFYFDSIKGTAWVEKGILRTDNLHIDGLEADITLQGKVDLVQQRLDLAAAVVPEIALPVGVAAAFTINPVVGAAVFAASKVFSPLWDKISLLNYHLSGPFTKPVVREMIETNKTKG